MLYTKCILSPKESKDGLRISIMSRHTLSDGITADERISCNLFDEHNTILAPPARLIGDYYKRSLGWEVFSERYIAYIRGNRTALLEMQKLAERALLQDITILCIEEAHDKCHRSLLARECFLYLPKLNIVCK